MSSRSASGLIKIISFVLISLQFILSSCSNHKDSLTSKQRLEVQESVQKMADSIAADISREGPIAWIRYFEGSPDFFMASDGQLVFSNNEAANNFIENKLVKSISKINLRWSNIRIDPLTNTLAVMAANFHEDILDASGKITPTDGYFTAIAEQTLGGWKLRNVHWSVKSGR